MKLARQVALLAEVEELLRELRELPVARWGQSASSPVVGIPRSVFGVVLAFVRSHRPQRRELEQFLALSPGLDGFEAQNAVNPLAHQQALAGCLVRWLERHPDLLPEELLFVWGWVHARLPRAPAAPGRSRSPGPRQTLAAPSRPPPGRRESEAEKPRTPPPVGGFNQLAAGLAKFKKDS